MGQRIGPDPFKFGPWKVESKNGPILGQEGIEKLEGDLGMKSLPDMIFSKNELRLEFEGKLVLTFNATDALKTCEKEKCPDFQVAAADSWEKFKFITSQFSVSIAFNTL